MHFLHESCKFVQESQILQIRYNVFYYKLGTCRHFIYNFSKLKIFTQLYNYIMRKTIKEILTKVA